jgi:DNA-binding beta-propeller fold protein YncE
MTTLLVSFHGGADGINNVIAFPPGEAQRPLTSPASIDAIVHPLRELRKFLFSPDEGGLYVANGWNQMNQVVRFAPPDGSVEPWHFERVFADDGISHPFDLVLAFGGELFVSNQDSGAVTSYNAAGELDRKLEDGFKAVRGLAFDGEFLYVADSGNERVVAYDEGLKKAHKVSVSQPVHLLYEPTHRWLLIGSESENAVYAWNPAQPKSPAVELVAKANPKIDHTAGMALELLPDNRGMLYVASRKGRQILAFPLDLSGSMPVWSPKTTEVVLGPEELEEEPEFVGIQGGLYG